MGAVSGLSEGVIDAVEHTADFLDEPDNIALCEAVLAVKPKPRSKLLIHFQPYEPRLIDNISLALEWSVAMARMGCSVL